MMAKKAVGQMTALRKYERLETTGLWRAEPEGMRQEVGVVLGKRTLVISDKAGRALAHWSLAAIVREGSQVPALYAPDSEQSETLEISDDVAIEAIETIRRSLARGRGKRGLLRMVGLALVAIVVLGLGIFWVPDALRTHVAGVLLPAKQHEIGMAALAELEHFSGPVCATPEGRRALGVLKNRVLGSEDPTRLVVVPGGSRQTYTLPSGIIVINAALLENNHDPAVVAGVILAETLRETPALLEFLRAAGIGEVVELFASGTISPDAAKAYAEATVLREPKPVETSALLERFDARGIASRPYAFMVDPSGETVLELIEADATRDTESDAVLSDFDWVSLQGICG